MVFTVYRGDKFHSILQLSAMLLSAKYLFPFCVQETVPIISKILSLPWASIILTNVFYKSPNASWMIPHHSLSMYPYYKALILFPTHSLPHLISYLANPVLKCSFPFFSWHETFYVNDFLHSTNEEVIMQWGTGIYPASIGHFLLRCLCFFLSSCEALPFIIVLLCAAEVT